MGNSDYFEKIKKKRKKEIKKCLQSFASFKGSRGGSCLMFILQHADSSAMGLVLQAGQFWQIINKDCLSN